jgi:hypothetical protein
MRDVGGGVLRRFPTLLLRVKGVGMKRQMWLLVVLAVCGLTWFCVSGAGAAAVSAAKIVITNARTMTIKSGGTVTADSGSTVTISGSTNTARGLASNYYLARGSVAYAGTTAVVTGLTSIVSATATMNDASSATCLVTVSPSSGTLTLKTWKVGTDNVYSQASASRTVYWIAVGTK